MRHEPSSRAYAAVRRYRHAEAVLEETRNAMLGTLREELEAGVTFATVGELLGVSRQYAHVLLGRKYQTSLGRKYR